MRIKNHNVYYCKHANLYRLTFLSPLIALNRMRLSRKRLIQFQEHNQTRLSMCRDYSVYAPSHWETALQCCIVLTKDCHVIKSNIFTRCGHYISYTLFQFYRQQTIENCLFNINMPTNGVSHDNNYNWFHFIPVATPVLVGVLNPCTHSLQGCFIRNGAIVWLP